MNNKRYFSRTILFTLINSSLLTVIASSAIASSFQEWEQTAIGAGVAHADMAAGAYDPSTAYYNPAGMTRLEDPTMSIGNMWAVEVVDITGVTSNYTGTSSPFVPFAPYGSVPSTTANFDAAIPNFYVVYPFKDLPFEPVFGLAINGPYGGGTYYDNTVLTTYSKKSTVKAILINPSLAIKITEKLSLGAGFDVQELKTDFTSDFTGSGAYPEGFLFFTGINNKMSDWATGWNIGLLYELTEATRAGITYRSKMKYNLDGTLDLTQGNDPPTTIGLSANSKLDLPATTTLGIFHDLTEDISLMATAAYTQWDVLQDFKVNSASLAQLGRGGFFNSSYNIPLEYENSWFFAVGADYEFAESWIARTGFYYDATPSNNDTRELRAPDADRYTFAFGLGYEITDKLRIDGAYEFLFTPAVDWSNTQVPNVLQNDPESGFEIPTYSGKAKSYANFWGVQLTYDFCCGDF